MGMDVSVRWYGGEALSRVRTAAAEGLNLAAEELLGAAKELSPVRSGDNRASGAVQEATPTNLMAWVTFNMRYSVRIHEGTHLNFSTVKNPQAQAKYLSVPLVRDRNELVAIVSARIRRALT